MSFDFCNANQVLEQDIWPPACRRLWCAVIAEQLSLVVSPAAADKAVDIDRARRWFGSRDFFTVCALAGLDGEAVLHGVRRRFPMAGVA